VSGVIVVAMSPGTHGSGVERDFSLKFVEICPTRLIILELNYLYSPNRLSPWLRPGPAEDVYDAPPDAIGLVA